MRIVFPRFKTFQFHEAYDGGSKYVYYLSKALVEKGINVTIVTTKHPKDPKIKHMKKDGIDYVFLNPNMNKKKLIKLNIPHKFIFSYNLKKYLNSIDFDVLHSAESFAWPYLHQKKRKPVFFQCWGMEGWYGKLPMSQKGLKKLYVKLFLTKPWQYCIENSETVVADEEYQVPKITKLGVEKKKIFFLPNGVNFFEIQKKKYKNRRKELGFKQDDFVVLSLCQVAPDKGIDDIINGFTLAKKEIPNAKLLMIGRGSLEPMMWELVKKKKIENSFVHLKNIPEEILFDYYFNADIFVSAATCEDFMINIQEAMSCGLPIVSSAQPFLVNENINGHVVGMKNPKGIKEGIIKLYKNRNRKKMGEASRKMAKQYDYKYLAETVLKEYKKWSQRKK